MTKNLCCVQKQTIIKIIPHTHIAIPNNQYPQLPPPGKFENPGGAMSYEEDPTIQLGLFGRSGNSIRRQSMSRAINIPSYEPDSSDDDNGLVTIDPLTHQKSIVRPAEPGHTSKEVLDRIDKVPHASDPGKSSNKHMPISPPQTTANNNNNNMDAFPNPMDSLRGPRPSGKHDSFALTLTALNTHQTLDGPGSPGAPQDGATTATHTTTSNATPQQKQKQPPTPPQPALQSPLPNTTPLSGPSKKTPAAIGEDDKLADLEGEGETAQTNNNIDATNLPVMANVQAATPAPATTTTTNTSGTANLLNFANVYLNNASRQRVNNMERTIAQNHFNLDELAHPVLTLSQDRHELAAPLCNLLGIHQHQRGGNQQQQGKQFDASTNPEHNSPTLSAMSEDDNRFSYSMDFKEYEEALNTTLATDRNAPSVHHPTAVAYHEFIQPQGHHQQLHVKNGSVLSPNVAINPYNVNTYEKDIMNGDTTTSFSAFGRTTLATMSTSTIPNTLVSPVGSHQQAGYNAAQGVATATISPTNNHNHLREVLYQQQISAQYLKLLQSKQLMGESNCLSLQHPFFTTFIPNIYPLFNNIMATTITRTTLGCTATTRAQTQTAQTMMVNPPASITEGVVNKKHPWKGTTQRTSYLRKNIQVLRFALNINEYRELLQASTTPGGMNQPVIQLTESEQKLLREIDESTDKKVDDDDFLLFNAIQGMASTDPASNGAAGAAAGSVPQAHGKNQYNADKDALFNNNNNNMILPPSIDTNNNAPPAPTIQHGNKILTAAGGAGAAAQPKASVVSIKSPTQMTDYEFVLQQLQARRQLARTLVPPPQEVELYDESKVPVYHSTTEKDKKKSKKDKKEDRNTDHAVNTNNDDMDGQQQLPLPYGASGATTLAYLTKSLEQKPTKDLMKPRVVHFDNNSNTAGGKDVNGMAGGGGNGLRSILVHKYNHFETEKQLQHLHKIDSYEQLCRTRMRQGCLVYKYKNYVPTRRLIYLSHNDTQLTWRELTTKEEKRFDLYEQLTEYDKELFVLHDLYHYMLDNGIDNTHFMLYYQNFLRFYNNYLHNGNNVTLAASSVPLSPLPIVNNYVPTPGQYNEYTQSGTNHNLHNLPPQIYGGPTPSINSQFSQNFVTMNSLPHHLLSNTNATMTANNTTNPTGAIFKTTKSIAVDDIASSYYGPFVGQGFTSFVEQCKQGKAKPWYAATVSTKNETLNLVFLSCYDVTLWLQGINTLAPSVGKTTSYGKMLWLRTIMKINFIGYYDFVAQKTATTHSQNNTNNNNNNNNTDLNTYGTPHGNNNNTTNLVAPHGVVSCNVLGSDYSCSAPDTPALVDWSDKLLQPGSCDLRGIMPRQQYNSYVAAAMSNVPLNHPMPAKEDKKKK